MSKNLLIVALTIFSVTAISAGGAAANESRPDRDPIAREHRSAPIAQDVRLDEESLRRVFGSQSVDGDDSHVAKTGVWSSIKKGVKKAAKTVATGAKRAGVGVGSAVKRAAKGIAKSPVGQSVVRFGKDIKKGIVAAAKKVKKFYFPKKKK